MSLAGITIQLLLTVSVVSFATVSADSTGNSDITSASDDVISGSCVAGHEGKTPLHRFKRGRFRFGGFARRVGGSSSIRKVVVPEAMTKFSLPKLPHSHSHKSHDADIQRNRADEDGDIGRKRQADDDDPESRKDNRGEDGDVNDNDNDNDNPRYKETRRHVDTFLSGINHPTKNKVRRQFREVMDKTVKGSAKSRAKAIATLKKVAKFLLEFGPDAVDLVTSVMELIQIAGEFQAEAQSEEQATPVPAYLGMSRDRQTADDTREDEELLLMLQMMLQEQKSDASHVTSSFKIFSLVLVACIFGWKEDVTPLGLLL